MDDFENDPEGDRLIATLAFDEETGLSLPHQTQSTEYGEVPSFETLTRTEFPGFPYSTLYPQQNSLMRFLYASLASSKCSIIESPTGTGKSVTLLTTSLHWLLDHNKAVNAHLAKLRDYLQKEDSQSVDETDWVAAHSRRRVLRIRVNKEMEPLEATQKASVEAAKLIKHANEVKVSLKSSNFVRSSIDITRENFPPPFEALNEWARSEDDSFLPTADTDPSKTSAVSVVEATNVTCRVVQVIYCTRTHSQLAQVVEELNKLKGLSDQVTMVTLASRQHLCVNKAVYGLKDQTLITEACLDLAVKSPGCRFRCRNEVGVLSDYLVGARVSAIKAALRIRGAMDQVDIEELPACACPYYANKRGLPLAQLVLAPYQSVVVPSLREAVGLCLQNNVLIFDEAHNLLEAVAAAFSATASYADLLATERLVAAFLGYYHSRLSPLSALRLRQLALVVRLFANFLEGKAARSSGLCAHCGRDSGTENCNSTGEIVYTLGDFLFAAGLDHINLSYLVDYLRSDRCVHKIVGFGKWFGGRKRSDRGRKEESDCAKRVGTGLSLSECLKQMKRLPNRLESFQTPPSKISKTGEDQQASSETVATASASATASQTPEDLQSAGAGLFAVLGLLEAMVNSDRAGDNDGRLIITLRGTAAPASTTSSFTPGFIRFVILNPGRYLHDAVKDARSVILVGGTMKPFDEFIDQVFRPAGKVETDVTLFSCGHVIDAKRQLAIYTPSVSFNDIPWDFTFKNRHTPRLIDECGEFLVEVCKMIPGGVAVFFQSFDYLSMVWNHWKATGLLARLQATKEVFREPRTAITLVEVMQAYTAAVTALNKRGACIVCVIGGKLSEGINFNDDLARGVIIVGLPYPNVHSAFVRFSLTHLLTITGAMGSDNSMREKLNFLERHFGGRESGRRFCEAVCMRMVNQAIGRAIRHAHDYAVVFLVDQRFATSRRLRLLLPPWAQDALMSDTISLSPPQLDLLHHQLHEFFHRNSTSSH
ncbi:Putative ATP-dependent RNA helicase DDX11-like protein [Echinococcus granulosus]|uniref:ATP-dependent RNA helicase DDX11-like protein n=1 Tax=Echinococcus granulosus TaxID=6210 RepID=W6UQL1_ECHGR|nr:Putative ATP-dependent RNA helicase DDX11-like protein [Echinococcus granulosus]EUB63503.1 Putative ATP-dependent RNA helicase DDX11-like protein [Echinococcus granulosus]